MSTDIQKSDASSTMLKVIAQGDLADLNDIQKVEFYNNVCSSLGLNPLTKPFEFITLNKKLTLYARRDCADQLRKINNISIEVTDKGFQGDLYIVNVRATDKIGRQDEDLGIVSVKGLYGEGLANAMLKAITKAKRRVTLSISGLGLLDESEVADIPAEKVMTNRNETPPLQKKKKLEDIGDVIEWFFVSFGIKESIILEYFGRPSYKDMDENDLRILKEIAVGLKAGSLTRETAFQIKNLMEDVEQ